ncbi:hypothetical protein [Polyangium jinanense]|uniref:Lipoprotein n=1 Tax=Polyangium jinanense TaxID=2829994 RepID=A0A9X3X6F6_9BACT|nr:hypothetical protein [Polyangium jinanense]MDC3955704.1 hypothetical protein [Polyangium jinanense]MDC3982346.1 hypothetical protein [Polyangium jinanense]
MSVSARPFVFLAALVALASGCGGNRPAVAPAVDLAAGARAAPPEAESDGEVLIWGKQDDGLPATYRVADDGRVLGEEPGIVIATSRGELVWREREAEVKLGGCEGGTPPENLEPGTVTHAWLAPRDDQARQVIVDPGDDGAGVGELSHHVELLGSVGPYLFVHEDVSVFSCGAHGNTVANFKLWDAEAGKEIDLMRHLPNKEALARRAEPMLDEGDMDPEEARKHEAIPDLVQIFPVYGERGGLRIDAQFARDDCYACSDGLWSGYTRSVILPSESMPERFAPWSTPPVAVVKFLQSHPGFTLRGWSRG